ncbi:MAG: LysR family transcriptional regulator [Selenomonadaceae bacterium]|nr:LysR family transcriptional regulator [Selenomonadaceae bacterium]
MNSKQIDCILELAQSLNFNRAAENLYIAQPTLTYHIKTVEEEIGFTLFHRSGKGATLTPAGQQFCMILRNLREELKRAIEQGQNNSRRYQHNLTIGLPLRSAIYFLSQAIAEFERTHTGVSVTPEFIPLHSADRFLRGEEDMVFAREEDMKRIPDIRLHPLFKSKIYLITTLSDPLAQKELVRLEDLAGRTLMVGGGSQPELRAVQQRALAKLRLDHFNSNDHDTTLTNVAAGKGICLAPGFLNDHNGEFAWTPFDCRETISCVICTHASDQRPLLMEFIGLLKKCYERQTDFPV